jgi:hypothetical protein
MNDALPPVKPRNVAFFSTIPGNSSPGAIVDSIAPRPTSPVRECVKAATGVDDPSAEDLKLALQLNRKPFQKLPGSCVSAFQELDAPAWPACQPSPTRWAIGKLED